jgi:hypothetical protein
MMETLTANSMAAWIIAAGSWLWHFLIRITIHH